MKYSDIFARPFIPAPPSRLGSNPSVTHSHSPRARASTIGVTRVKPLQVTDLSFVLSDGSRHTADSTVQFCNTHSITDLADLPRFECGPHELGRVVRTEDHLYPWFKRALFDGPAEVAQAFRIIHKPPSGQERLEIAITANSGDSSRPDLQLIDYDTMTPDPTLSPGNFEGKLMETLIYGGEPTLPHYQRLIHAPGGQGWDCSDLERKMYQEASTSTAGHQGRFYNVLTQACCLSFPSRETSLMRLSDTWSALCQG